MKSVLVLFSLLNYATLQSDDIDKFVDKNYSKPNGNTDAGGIVPDTASCKCIHSDLCDDDDANRRFDDHCGPAFVCCSKPIVFPRIMGPCITPGGEQGECVVIDDCPVLANLFANPIKGSIEFIYKFKCSDRGLSLYVCCISGWNSTNYGEKLSDRRYCGYQHTDDYFYTGNTTSIDEFPWLAALVSTRHGKERILCHGSLINNRYILTTAWCVLPEPYRPSNFIEYNKKTGKWNFREREAITKVLLGKYTAKNATGCVDHEQYGLECTEVQEFGIEEKIRHPFWDYLGLYEALFDIALIRLNKTTSYTDYIRPICLPTQGIKFAEVGETLYTTGWGGVNFDESTPVKKKVKTILITSEECQNSSHETVLSTHHICTLGLSFENNSEYSCFYDAGVPVMYSYRNQWQIEGIARAGSTCGATHRLSVLSHTRVSPYIDWIKQNVRP